MLGNIVLKRRGILALYLQLKGLSALLFLNPMAKHVQTAVNNT